jgi:hypothetical protein
MEKRMKLANRTFQVDASEERLEARIGAQRISDRLDGEIDQAVVMLIEGTIEVQESVVKVAEAEISAGDVKRRNVALARDGLQLGENS